MLCGQRLRKQKKHLVKQQTLMETRKSISGAADLGVDLAGVDLDGEDLDGAVLVGVEDGAGENEKKTKTRSEDGIMDLKRELYPRNIHRLTASFPIRV